MAVKVLVKSQDQKQALCIIYFCSHLTNHQVLSFLYILSAHIKLFENNYTGLWYFFAGPLFITKVSPRSTRQYYFCAKHASRHVLDGYVRKTPTPLHQYTQRTRRPHPRPTRPRTCHFQCCGRLFRPGRLTTPVPTLPSRTGL